LPSSFSASLGSNAIKGDLSSALNQNAADSGREAKHLTSEWKESKIAENNNRSLLLEIKHKHITTEEEADMTRRYYQKLFTEKYNKEVPLHEVTIKPDVGEEVVKTTVTHIRFNQPLYIGAVMMVHENPRLGKEIINELKAILESIDDCSGSDKVELELLLRRAITCFTVALNISLLECR